MKHLPASALLVLLALAIGPAGCNILGPAAYLIGGLPKLDAEHELIDRPTVVYVDDRANVIPTSARIVRLAIADRISTDLMKNEVLLPENTIAPRDAMGLVQAHDRAGDLLAIDEIGRQVGAEQVIYVEMAGFSWTPDGVTPRPTAACRVRVLDVNARRRLYPDGDLDTATSRPITVGLPEIDPAVLRSTAGRLKVFEALAEETGDKIAKLFYRHEPRELGENLQDR